MKHNKFYIKKIQHTVKTQLTNKCMEDYNKDPNNVTLINKYFQGEFIRKGWMFVETHEPYYVHEMPY